MANIAAEVKQFFGGTKTQRMFIGIVKVCSKKNATKVVVPEFKFDERLLAYFREPTTFYAYDPSKSCKPGDTVLIKELETNKTTLITHEVLKVLFPLGDVTDPVTGRKVFNLSYNKPKYRDEVDKINKVYGESPNRFIYENAPPRGWQEGKRDFSDKEVKLKIHDDGTNNPYIADW